MINILVDESRVRSLFAAYYNNFAEPIATKRRRFKLSELLLMTSILLISLSCLTEDDFRRTDYTPVLQLVAIILQHQQIFWVTIAKQINSFTEFVGE